MTLSVVAIVYIFSARGSWDFKTTARGIRTQFRTPKKLFPASLQQAKNAVKELGSYSSLPSFSRCKELAKKEESIHPVVLSRLAFQSKKFVEQRNIAFGLFLGVIIFLSVYELLC